MCQKKLSNGIPLTETNPKALLYLLGLATLERPLNSIRMGDLIRWVRSERIHQSEGDPDHKRDAALSAVAAFAMDSQREAGKTIIFVRHIQFTYSSINRATGSPHP